jgi:hypothetical protein
MWELLGQADWGLISAILLGIATALKILDHFFGWFGAIWLWVRNLIGGKPNSDRIQLPKQTVILLPSQQHRPFWWHMGTEGDKPCMQLAGHFQVTNIADGDVLLSGVKLRKPKVRGHVLVRVSKQAYLERMRSHEGESQKP